MKRLAAICSLLTIMYFSYGCGNAEETQLSNEQKAVPKHPGMGTYKKFCKVCHAQGINGAPIVGNQAMWSSRLPKGEAELVESAKNGYGLMPANLERDPALDSEAIELAVQFMLSELR